MNFSELKADSQNIKSQLVLVQSDVNNLNTTISTLRADVTGINTRLTNVTAQAVSNKCSIANINKKLSEIQTKPDPKIEEKIALAVSKEMEKTKESSIPSDFAEQMDKMNKEIDKLRAVQAVQRLAKSAPVGQMSAPNEPRQETEGHLYWVARKKLRCFPVKQGQTASETLANTRIFLHEVLAIPETELHEEAIHDVRRVANRKRSAAQDEVIITFDSVQTRDVVASYASNLATWRSNNRGVNTGLRLEVPDHLCGVFRVLERHAHNLKTKHSYFRRSIKYDDVELSLVLDYCIGENGTWQRANYQEAVEQTRGRLRGLRPSTDDGPSTAGQSSSTPTGST